jgi:hypothetical protein
VPLAPEGHAQARAAGDAVAEWITAQDGLVRHPHLLLAYQRTRETCVRSRRR